MAESHSSLLPHSNPPQPPLSVSHPGTMMEGRGFRRETVLLPPPPRLCGGFGVFFPLKFLGLVFCLVYS